MPPARPVDHISQKGRGRKQDRQQCSLLQKIPFHNEGVCASIDYRAVFSVAQGQSSDQHS